MSIKKGRRIYIEWLGPVFSGIMLCLSFPRANLSFLAWFALVPVLISIRNDYQKKVFPKAFIAALIYFTCSLSWITETMINYGGMSKLLSAVALLLLTLYLSLYPALAMWAAEFLRKKNIPFALSLPVAWTGAEYARAIMLTGFPWNSLGYSQYASLPLVQIAELTGVYGLTFLIVLVNSCIFEVFFTEWGSAKKRKSIFAGLAAVCFLAIYGYGIMRLRQFDGTAEGKRIKIGIVQGAIDQDKKWDPKYRYDIVKKYITETRKILKEEPALIVWPESATPFYYRYGSAYQYEQNVSMKQAVNNVIKNTETWLLTGTPDRDKENRHYNSAVLISPEGEIADTYHKIHLVPFGEYVPLRKLLFFVEKITVLEGDVAPGDDYVVFETPRFSFSAYICYETAFSNLVRKFKKNGAEFLVNLTNDTWFGDSSGPYQHFSMTVFRAVENRTPVIRVANTGISGYFNAAGRILERTELFQTAALTRDIRMPSSAFNHQTFFTKYGNLFGQICLFLLCLELGSIVLQAKSRSDVSGNGN